MSSISPSATFAPSSAAPHDSAATTLSEALAGSSHAEIRAALSFLSDDLLGTLSSFADATFHDRSVAFEGAPCARKLAGAKPPHHCEVCYHVYDADELVALLTGQDDDRNPCKGCCDHDERVHDVGGKLSAICSTCQHERPATEEEVSEYIHDLGVGL